MSRRGRKHRSNALSLSARDADWEVVREKAKRRRLSMSRYAEALVLGNDWEVRDGPALKLDGREQREILDTVREFRALMGDKAEASSLIADMQTRVALLFNAWAISMVRDGQREALRAILAARVEASSADQVVARIVALAEAPPALAPEPAAPRKRDVPPGQQSLLLPAVDSGGRPGE